MKSPLLLSLLWLATLALAFLLGSQLRPESAARDGGRPVPERREAAAPGAPSLPPAAETRDPSAAAPDPPAAAPASEDAPGEVRPVAVEPGMTVADLSALFMRYAAAKLAQGPEGHRELFRELDRLMRDKDVLAMVRDENQMMPLAYPWVRFLVDRDRQVVAMMETIYRTAAEDPQWFQGLDDNSLELFTEGLAALLPGVAGEEQLGRFRDYAERILELPKESLPEAIQKNLRDIERDLEWWSPPMTPEQVVQALNDPGQPLAAKIGLLRRARPEALRGVDVTAIVAGGVREGNRQAMTALSRLQEQVSVPAVDAAFLDAIATGKAEWHHVTSYAHATRRTTWDTLRPFLDTGLARGGNATAAFAQSLLFFRHLAPKEYVSGVLATYPLPEEVRTMVKKRYEIE